MTGLVSLGYSKRTEDFTDTVAIVGMLKALAFISFLNLGRSLANNSQTPGIEIFTLKNVFMLKLYQTIAVI